MSCCLSVVCLSVCLPACLSASLSVCLSVCLFCCLSVSVVLFFTSATCEALGNGQQCHIAGGLTAFFLNRKSVINNNHCSMLCCRQPWHVCCLEDQALPHQRSPAAPRLHHGSLAVQKEQGCCERPSGQLWACLSHAYWDSRRCVTAAAYQ